MLGGDRIHPTRDDSIVAGLSEGVGGPLGAHASRHPWWTPTRVVLLLAALCFSVGMVQKNPCFNDGWRDNYQRYGDMCYSDLPYLYTGRGLAELTWPYDADPEVRARHEVMEYPAGISYWAWGTAWVTHWVAGSPNVDLRFDVGPDQVWSLPGMLRETKIFVVVNALGFAALTLLTAFFLSKVNRRRPWDAAIFAVSPTLALTGLINWDLLAVAMVAGALWAWERGEPRGRPIVTGVLIGLGTATKLYPLFLIGALLVICIKDRRLLDLLKMTVAAALTWAVANAPAYLTGPDQWRVFWSFNSNRGADLGSVWLAAAQMFDLTLSPQTINRWSWILFIAWCAGVFLVGMFAKRTPSFAQLGFLIVAGFLLVNKVYSPQYVLWLLPLAALARPRWRDQLVWQGCEVFYFMAVWWYLGGYIASASGGEAPLYWLAILLRMAGELYLVAMVVRDILRADSPTGSDPIGVPELGPIPSDYLEVRR